MGAVHAIGGAERCVAKGFAAVIGSHDAGASEPDSLVIVRVDAKLAEIGRARIGCAHVHPGCAFIFAAKHASLRVLHQRVHNVRIAPVNIQRDAAGVAVRQTGGQFVPRRSAVGGLVDRAVGASAVVSGDRTAMLIGRCIQCFRAFWIDGDVVRAGVVVDVEHLRPRLSAVGGLENTAFVIWSPQMAGGGDIYDIRIARMNHDPAVVMRIGQAHVLPGDAGVERAVHSVSPGRTLPVIGFSRS